MKRRINNFDVIAVWASLMDFPQLSQMLSGRLSLETYLKRVAKQTLKLYEKALEDHRVRQGVVDSLAAQRKKLDPEAADYKEDRKILDANFRYSVEARDSAFRDVRRYKQKLDYIAKQLRRFGA